MRRLVEPFGETHVLAMRRSEQALRRPREPSAGVTATARRLLEASERRTAEATGEPRETLASRSEAMAGREQRALGMAQLGAG